MFFAGKSYLDHLLCNLDVKTFCRTNQSSESVWPELMKYCCRFINFVICWHIFHISPVLKWNVINEWLDSAFELLNCQPTISYNKAREHDNLHNTKANRIFLLIFSNFSG